MAGAQASYLKTYPSRPTSRTPSPRIWPKLRHRSVSMRCAKSWISP